MLKCTADGKGGQTIEDTGPLTKKRMETIDDESIAVAKEFITRHAKAGKPFFCWWNGTRMHFRTHVKPEHKGISGKSGDEYHDGMVEHDMHVGELLQLIDDLGIADNTIVQYSTDNGPHYNTWPMPARRPSREKNSTGKVLIGFLVLFAGLASSQQGVTLNGIVSHEDWLPTFAAAAGAPDIKEKLKTGIELNGRKYKNYIDGYNLLDYLVVKTEESPRNEFIYVDDGGHIACIRVGDWKAVYLENRAEKLQIWKEPFVHLRAPDLYNLRRDPFEKAKLGSNTYEDWY